MVGKLRRIKSFLLGNSFICSNQVHVFAFLPSAIKRNDEKTLPHVRWTDSAFRAQIFLFHLELQSI